MISIDPYFQLVILIAFISLYYGIYRIYRMVECTHEMAHDFIANAHLMVLSDEENAESPDEEATPEEIDAWDNAKV